jgi:hypothetical protein
VSIALEPSNDSGQNACCSRPGSGAHTDKYPTASQWIIGVPVTASLHGRPDSWRVRSPLATGATSAPMRPHLQGWSHASRRSPQSVMVGRQGQTHSSATPRWRRGGLASASGSSPLAGLDPGDEWSPLAILDPQGKLVEGGRVATPPGDRARVGCAERSPMPGPTAKHPSLSGSSGSSPGTGTPAEPALRPGVRVISISVPGTTCLGGTCFATMRLQSSGHPLPGMLECPAWAASSSGRAGAF